VQLKSSFIGIVHKIWFLDQIIKAGNFKTASSFLGVTPSALTQSVKTLENHFEKTFIVRDKGNIVLTSEGQALLEKFSSVLEELEGLDQEYSEQDGPKKIRIGAYDSLAIRYLPKLYSNILEVNPNVKIDLQIGRSAELITLIHRGHLDMALVVAPQDSDTYFTTPLAYNYLSIYTHVNNINEKINIHNLGIGCLRSESDGRQSFIVKALNLLGIKSKDINVQTDSFEALLSLCIEGKISAILPVDLASRHADFLIDVSDQYNAIDIKNQTKHELSLITRKNFPPKWKNQIEGCLKEINIK
jgi:DNA-binding transcriptional LysR family regulator